MLKYYLLLRGCRMEMENTVKNCGRPCRICNEQPELVMGNDLKFKAPG